MPKFFAPDCDLRCDTVQLNGENAEHLRVLRVRVGENLTLCDNRGMDARCSVVAVTAGAVVLQVLERSPARGEPTVSVRVYAGLPKGDKGEVIVQKSVELGAEEIVFFLSERSVSRPDGKGIGGKLARWNKVCEAAAMQSYRGKLPSVRWLPDLESALLEASGAQLAAFLWEETGELSLRGLMKSRTGFRSAALITGPEGGFSAAEAKAAGALGIPPVTLGPRILRCETAPICALAAVMYETGNME